MSAPTEPGWYRAVDSGEQVVLLVAPDIRQPTDPHLYMERRGYLERVDAQSENLEWGSRVEFPGDEPKPLVVVLHGEISGRLDLPPGVRLEIAGFEPAALEPPPGWTLGELGGGGWECAERGKRFGRAREYFSRPTRAAATAAAWECVRKREDVRHAPTATNGLEAPTFADVRKAIHLMSGADSTRAATIDAAIDAVWICVTGRGPVDEPEAIDHMRARDVDGPEVELGGLSTLNELRAEAWAATVAGESDPVKALEIAAVKLIEARVVDRSDVKAPTD